VEFLHVGSKGGNAIKILLAEADGAPAGRLFHLLVKSGYQTTAVKTGQAAPDCLIKPVDDNELLRITALQRRTQTGGERCRNLSFLSSTTLDPKRAARARQSIRTAALVPVKKPMRKCKKNRAAGELEGVRPASNEILRSACPQSPRRALGTS